MLLSSVVLWLWVIISSTSFFVTVGTAFTFLIYVLLHPRKGREKESDGGHGGWLDKMFCV